MVRQGVPARGDGFIIAQLTAGCDSPDKIMPGGKKLPARHPDPFLLQKAASRRLERHILTIA